MGRAIPGGGKGSLRIASLHQSRDSEIHGRDLVDLEVQKGQAGQARQGRHVRHRVARQVHPRQRGQARQRRQVGDGVAVGPRVPRVDRPRFSPRQPGGRGQSGHVGNAFVGRLQDGQLRQRGLGDRGALPTGRGCLPAPAAGRRPGPSPPRGAPCAHPGAKPSRSAQGSGQSRKRAWSSHPDPSSSSRGGEGLGKPGPVPVYRKRSLIAPQDTSPSDVVAFERSRSRDSQETLEVLQLVGASAWHPLPILLRPSMGDAMPSMILLVVVMSQVGRSELNQEDMQSNRIAPSVSAIRFLSEKRNT